MMVTYGFGYLIWMANTINGGMNGSDWHLFWITLSKVLCVAPIMTVIFTIVAWSSYGSQSAVYTSWSGSSNYASNTIVTASLNNNYLLFMSNSATGIPSANYNLNAAVAWWAYDTQYAWSLALTLIFSVFQAVLCGFSWHIFDDQYHWMVEHNMRMRILADCEVDGSCPTFDPATVDSTVISSTG